VCALLDIWLVKKLIAAVVLGVALFMTVPAWAEPEWLTDYKKAEQEAKTTNKLVLLNFTGSDWCGWCILLDKEVFSKPEFKDYASKNLILVEVDFPRRKQQSAELRTQNQTLAEHFQIEGFPTIVVLNGDGKAVGELGYTPGGPGPFIAQLEKLRKS
jgi:thioredoxin-related protein